MTYFRSQRGPTKPNNRTNSTKEFSEQFEGVIGSLPRKTRVLRQIAPERSAKSLSRSFFVVPFLSPNIGGHNEVDECAKQGQTADDW